MTGDALAAARRKATELRRAIQSLHRIHGDSPPMRRLMSDLGWIESGLGELPVVALPATDRIPVPDTPYTHDMWQGADDEGLEEGLREHVFLEDELVGVEEHGERRQGREPVRHAQPDEERIEGARDQEPEQMSDDRNHRHPPGERKQAEEDGVPEGPERSRVQIFALCEICLRVRAEEGRRVREEHEDAQDEPRSEHEREEPVAAKQARHARRATLDSRWRTRGRRHGPRTIGAGGAACRPRRALGDRDGCRPRRGAERVDEDRGKGFAQMPEFVAWRDWIAGHPQYLDVAADGGTMPDAQIAAKVCWRLNGLPDVSAW